MLREIVYTEQQLVESLRHNQRDGFDFFYDQYAPAIYGLVCKMVNDKDIAGTVMEETFLEFWGTIRSYNKSEGSVFIWVLHIARKNAREYLLHHNFVPGSI